VAASFEWKRVVWDIPRATFERTSEAVREALGLDEFFHSLARELSLGQKMRADLGLALLHEPEILFLDEPTIGLDVVVKHKIRELIREMNREEGTTLFLTSHDAGDIEQLCKRAIVINHGQIILNDTVSNVKREYFTHKTIHLKLHETPPAFAIPGVTIVKQKESGLRLSVDTSATTIESVLAHIVQHYRLEDVTIEDPSMEEIITHIYERTAKEVG
jgi:ABC-2 type transport system ATP-binding protein